MKKIYATLATVLFTAALMAQQAMTISPADYANLKAQHQLDPNVHYVLANGNVNRNTTGDARVPAPVSTQSTSCNCIVPLDTTFSVVPFQWSSAPNYRNDDASTSAIAIPFSFNFYGTMYDSIYINNNGNISFGTGYMTFTADSFPSTSYSMIAPFWADVDTRDSASGLVYYKIAPGYVIIRWDSVGYYAMHSDKRSTFQLIITDGVDTILPAGQNVSFCYGDMQWTTGDASMGVNGFGGVASTTGVNEGNGTDYFQVTRSIDSTSNFDGPYGSADGVSWLDGLEIGFNTAINGNIPPLVMNNSICDTIDVYTGDTIRTAAIDSIAFDFFVTTPEADQQITSSITTNAPVSALTYSMTINENTVQAYHCIFDARNLSPGAYYVTVTGSDNGTPSMQTSSTVYIETHYDSTLNSIADHSSIDIVSVYPNPAGDNITVQHGTDVSAIILTDVNGNVISTTTANGKSSEINTADLAAGVYFLRLLKADGSAMVTRFMKD